MDAFLVFYFSIWLSRDALMLSRDALMLSGAGTLSDFSRILLVESKIVFKSLGMSISDSSTWFVQGNAVGKIKPSFLNFTVSDLFVLF